MSGVIEVPELVEDVYELDFPENSAKDTGLGGLVERASAGLNPFDFCSAQGSLALGISLSAVQDQYFVDRESMAVAEEILRRRFLRIFRRRYTVDQVRAAAEARFDKRVAPTIACTMAAVSTSNAMYALSFMEPNLTVRENLENAGNQIDRVDLCQMQIYNTIKTGRVRRAYVDCVAARVEQAVKRILGR